MYKNIYLTGAPATGKSTACNNLRACLSEIEIFSYNSILSDILNERMSIEVNPLCESDLRARSSELITWPDVQEADRRLQSVLDETSRNMHLIIDSHPVTVEEYGIRVTPFGRRELESLNLDCIVCLFASANVISNRIKENAQGRPLPSHEKISTILSLQLSVASQYATMIGKPLYILESNVAELELAHKIIEVCDLA